MSRRRIIAAVRSGNNYYVPVEPTPPWREEDEQRWARWERMSYKPDPLPPDPEPEAPKPETPAPGPEPEATALPVAETVPEPEPVPLIETFAALNCLLAKYLSCSDHQ